MRRSLGLAAPTCACFTSMLHNPEMSPTPLALPSYADVMDSAKGWAGTIRFNDRLWQQFQAFYARPDTFSLGVCNGCQVRRRVGGGSAGWVGCNVQLLSTAQCNCLRAQAWCSGRLGIASTVIRGTLPSPSRHVVLLPLARHLCSSWRCWAGCPPQAPRSRRATWPTPSSRALCTTAAGASSRAGPWCAWEEGVSEGAGWFAWAGLTLWAAGQRGTAYSQLGSLPW